MTLPELIRWVHFFILDLLGRKSLTLSELRKKLVDKQFNGVVHFRLSNEGLDQKALDELNKLIDFINRKNIYEPNKGDRCKVYLEFI